LKIKKKRVDDLFTIVNKELSNFKFKIERSSIYNSIHIRWRKSSPEGFCITCPNDLDLDRYICEICLINSNNALYSHHHYIDRICTYDDLFTEFFKYYFLYSCLIYIPKAFINLSVRNLKKSIHSLFTLSRSQLSTTEIYYIRTILVQ
jgi:hypothetical protein